MKNQKGAPKDMTFILKREIKPLSWMLNTRNTARNPLEYYDENKNIRRILRYASNQKSCFVDEQEGQIILEPVVFEDGALFVPKSNPALQQFLTLHPKFGVEYVLLDKEKDAQEEYEREEKQIEAADVARKMGLEQKEMIARVMLGMNTNKMSSAEIKRDVIRYAKNNPEEFLNAIDDSDIEVEDIAAQAFNNGLLTTRRNDTEVWYSLDENKGKMMNIPFGEDPAKAVSRYMKTDEGLEVLKVLKTKLENMD